MKVNGFTAKGIEWYHNRLARLVLEGLKPVEAYEKVSRESGMTVQSFRQRISVKEIKQKALELAGTATLKEYFDAQTSIRFNKEGKAA